MALKVHEHIGVCRADKDGKIIELRRGFFRQGWIFKDWEAFHNRSDIPCYVPELHDAVYTRNDLMAICNGQEKIAERLFHEAEWQNLFTLMDEWECTGEIGTCRKCGKLYLLFNVNKCPYCGADHEGGHE